MKMCRLHFAQLVKNGTYYRRRNPHTEKTNLQGRGGPLEVNFQSFLEVWGLNIHLILISNIEFTHENMNKRKQNPKEKEKIEIKLNGIHSGRRHSSTT